jgi:hypothetical protein
MIEKDTLTKIFLKQANISISKANIKYYMRKWWYSVRGDKNTTFRLSDDGVNFLINELHLIPYKIFVSNEIVQPAVIIFLNKYIDSPYYVESHMLTLFNERKALELQFFASDLARYGIAKSIACRQRSPADDIDTE